MSKVHPQQQKPNAPAPAKAPVAANVPAAPASAKPGTKDEKAKKEGKKRTAYPGLKNGEEAMKLKEVPSDFDPKLHKPLQRKDFEDESLWYELRARELEKKAAEMRQLGVESKSLGKVADRAKAKRLVQMQKKMAELSAAMAAQGIDVEALLAAATPAKKEEAKA